MAYIISQSYDPKYKVKIRALDDVTKYQEWERQLYSQNIPIRGMTGGIEVPAELIPRRFEITQKRIPEYGVFNLLNAHVIDERFVEAIEKYEPGVHRFHSLDVEMADGRPLPHKQYFLNCCTAVDSVDPERSKVKKKGEMPDGSWSERWYYTPIIGTFEEIFLLPERIEGRAMWFDHRLKRLLISDAAMSELTRSGVEGFHISPHISEQ